MKASQKKFGMVEENVVHEKNVDVLCIDCFKYFLHLTDVIVSLKYATRKVM